MADLVRRARRPSCAMVAGSPSRSPACAHGSSHHKHAAGHRDPSVGMTLLPSGMSGQCCSPCDACAQHPRESASAAWPHTRLFVALVAQQPDDAPPLRVPARLVDPVGHAHVSGAQASSEQNTSDMPHACLIPCQPAAAARSGAASTSPEHMLMTAIVDLTSPCPGRARNRLLFGSSSFPARTHTMAHDACSHGGAADVPDLSRILSY